MKVNRSLEIPESELGVRFSRSSGPGGQNVNRRATKAEIIFDVGASPSLSERQRTKLLRMLARKLDAEGRLHVVAQDGRTQLENRERALERLRTMLGRALAPPPKPRVATKPTRSAKEKRLSEKRLRARRKELRGRPAGDE